MLGLYWCNKHVLALMVCWHNTECYDCNGFTIHIQAFRIDDDGDMEALSDEDANAVINCELTIDEFADALSLKPSAMFVKNMFELIDKDKNGLVSFREFLDMIVIFAKGKCVDNRL